MTGSYIAEGKTLITGAGAVFDNDAIIAALRQHPKGTTAVDLIEDLGVSEEHAASFKRRLQGMTKTGFTVRSGKGTKKAPFVFKVNAKGTKAAARSAAAQAEQAEAE